MAERPTPVGTHRARHDPVLALNKAAAAHGHLRDFKGLDEVARLKVPHVGGSWFGGWGLGVEDEGGAMEEVGRMQCAAAKGERRRGREREREERIETKEKTTPMPLTAEK